MKGMTYNQHETTSTFVRHEPCPSCGSRDNLGRFSDGHGYCFGCHYREFGDSTGDTFYQQQNEVKFLDLIDGEVTPLPARGLSEETCQKWDYRVGEMGGQKVQIANYRDRNGTRVAQKIRFRNKDFTVRGDMKKVSLYGEHLWSGKGKKAIITEGEIDALSVSQTQGNQWPVYSVPTGAGGAVNCIRKSLELLSGYEEVVFMFDSDEAGQKAAVECAQLMPPGKAKIAKLPLKDANEMLVQDRVQDLINCIWQATVFRPDGIICGTELWDIVLYPIHTKVSTRRLLAYERVRL
jgi:twinkle protein